MNLSGSQTFVGFGFGPIQAGLFVLEAFRSGRFSRIVIGEVLADVVRDVREDGGRFSVNIAHRDRVEALSLYPVEIENPIVPEDRGRLAEAIASASEVATAVPSVAFYRSDSPGSLHRILAEGLVRRFGSGASGKAVPLVVYAAENHNRAAEILEEAVLSEVSPEQRDRVREGTQFLNSVVGKMSGVVPVPDLRGLTPVTSRASRAFLVESFNRILITQVRFGADSGFRRGIEVFEEKPDLLPFEEAKLYGHNAAHALAAYVAVRLGLSRMAELRDLPEAVDFVRAAFLEESGVPLQRRWGGTDPLFTPDGYRAYADDLIERMLSPHLGDLVGRVARDPTRKLGWEDRLVGTMRLALGEGVLPRRFALGAAAALAALAPEVLQDLQAAEERLVAVWAPSGPDPAERDEVVRLILQGIEGLRTWTQTGVAPFKRG